MDDREGLVYKAKLAEQVSPETYLSLFVVCGLTSRYVLFVKTTLQDFAAFKCPLHKRIPVNDLVGMHNI